MNLSPSYVITHTLKVSIDILEYPSFSEEKWLMGTCDAYSMEYLMDEDLERNHPIHATLYFKYFAILRMNSLDSKVVKFSRTQFLALANVMK